MVAVSVDEKPGVQAIKNIAEDLAPVAGKHSSIGRDYEYKRLGTVSILAALDLHTGHVIAQVHDRHRSREFISLLKELDAYYPPETIIRVILDNHSAHISKETMGFLKTKPNRFVYVHTPKHGSWLNLVETLFGKMARTFLRHIRVDSKAELKQRILKGIAEINAAPVGFDYSRSSASVVETAISCPRAMSSATLVAVKRTFCFASFSAVSRLQGRLTILKQALMPCSLTRSTPSPKLPAKAITGMPAF